MTTSPGNEPAPGAVDRLLDELFDRLAGTGGAGRRALAEAEDHLRTATAEAIAAGLPAAQAQAEAVRRFGAADRIAGELRRTHLGPAAVLRSAFVGAWLVGGVGLLALGLSGLVSELFGRAFGAGFVAGDGPGVTYTADRCRDYFEYVPGAGSCSQAAAVHHWGEVVDNRVAAGVLGLLALLVLWAVRRRVLRSPAWRLPLSYVGTVLLALFALAAVLLGGTSLMELTFGLTSGVGASLADGLVAGAAAVALAVLLLRRVRDTARLPRPAGDRPA